MSQADLLTAVTANRFERTLPHSLAVLIEVPCIKPLPGARAMRTMPRATRAVARNPHRSRRRLRREVRLAGCTLMALVPIVSACTLGWSNRPDRIIACSISDPFQSQSTTHRDGSIENLSLPRENWTGPSAVASPGIVVLSTEPAVLAPGTAPETPVIFPGYVLPDDSREDSLHEGS
jgi:hypothetical protein